jgi:CheY-like chemotaxis protein
MEVSSQGDGKKGNTITINLPLYHSTSTIIKSEVLKDSTNDIVFSPLSVDDDLLINELSVNEISTLPTTTTTNNNNNTLITPIRNKDKNKINKNKVYNFANHFSDSFIMDSFNILPSNNSRNDNKVDISSIWDKNDDNDFNNNNNINENKIAGLSFVRNKFLQIINNADSNIDDVNTNNNINIVTTTNINITDNNLNTHNIVNKPLYVMVIDNNIDAVNFMCQSLRSFCSHCQGYTDSISALREIALCSHDKPYDVVIVDETSVMSDGTRVYIELRAIEYLGYVICILDEDSDTMPSSLIESGVDMVVRKPVNIEEIQQFLNNYGIDDSNANVKNMRDGIFTV